MKAAYDVIAKGGLVMIPLALCPVLALAVVIERACRWLKLDEASIRAALARAAAARARGARSRGLALEAHSAYYHVISSRTQPEGCVSETGDARERDG